MIDTMNLVRLIRKARRQDTRLWNTGTGQGELGACSQSAIQAPLWKRLARLWLR